MGLIAIVLAINERTQTITENSLSVLGIVLIAFIVSVSAIDLIVSLILLLAQIYNLIKMRMKKNSKKASQSQEESENKTQSLNQNNISVDLGQNDSSINLNQNSLQLEVDKSASHLVSNAVLLEQRKPPNKTIEILSKNNSIRLASNLRKKRRKQIVIFLSQPTSKQ